MADDAIVEDVRSVFNEDCSEEMVAPLPTDSEELIELTEEIVMEAEDIVIKKNVPSKRGHEEVEEEVEERWTTVVARKNVKLDHKIDVYVSSSENLPKQFAMAKLLKTHNIQKIFRVKYLSPFKVFIQFDDLESAEKLIGCKALQELGWRIQKPLEVITSYGVIKNIETDLEEKDMMEVIKSESELMAVKRLKRRTQDSSGWEASESVRLAFRGPTLPDAVYIYDMKINVKPYVFPVTQCSRCWRYGHLLRMCPTKKITCPKCGKGHANCETTIHKCINCAGSHTALDRSCPVFQKEKYLRNLMAENNYSYRKALQMYVPPEPPVSFDEPATVYRYDLPESAPAPTTQTSSYNLSYANAVKTKQTRDNPQRNIDVVSKQIPMNVSQSKEKVKKKKNKRRQLDNDQVFNWDVSSESECEKDILSDKSDTEKWPRRQRIEKRREENPTSTVSFAQLVANLSEIIFSECEGGMKGKISKIVSLFFEWVISVARQYLKDLPFKNFFGL